jgi:parallel beta-helix repeat protein/predicted outer membrane repeat protein
MTKIVFLIAFFSLPIFCQARTITVDDDGPADFKTIQAAINDSNDADVIIIKTGRYTGPGNRDIDFMGKAITVRSLDPNDPNIVASTIIDCKAAAQEHHRGFSFNSGETSSSVLAGLTITNGNMESGTGGGIYCGRSSPTISKCIITSNSAGSGGGVSCLGGSPKITNCTIIGNMCSSLGGGVWIRDGSRATLINCLISGNSAQYGGGISCWEKNSTTIINCTVTDNFASSCGGGIDSYSTYSYPTISHCILLGNSASNGPEISLRSSSSPSSLTVSYSDVQGGQAAVYIEYPCMLTWGTWNIALDPLFLAPSAGDYHLAANSPCIDAGDPAYTPEPAETDIDGESRLTGARVDIGADESAFIAKTPVIGCSSIRFRLASYEGGPDPKTQVLFIRNIGIGTLNWVVTKDSPCLEVYPMTGESINDIDEVILGADISNLPAGLHNCELTITADGASNSPLKVAVTLYISDGKLYVPAEYKTIQSAIDAAIDGENIIVADGIYTGDGNRDIDFNGKAITLKSENGPENCIIDCNGTEEELHRGFYFHNGEGADSIVSGFTITNGYNYNGGAIWCRYSSSPTLSKCIIRSNVAALAPGFPGNFATNGGGIYCSSLSTLGSPSPIINECYFMDNIATGDGGAICSFLGSALVRNCVFRGNQANSGGAIVAYEDNISIHNCVISNNSASNRFYGGGAIYCSRSTATISNCTISRNRTVGYGGGIYVTEGNVNTKVNNSILWENAASKGTQIALKNGGFGPASLTISYSDSQGGAAAVYVDPGCTLNWGQGNIAKDPCFADPCNFDYHLKSQAGRWDANEGRWTVDKVTSLCIDAGDPDSPIGLEPFPNGGIINIGAYGGTAEASKSYFGEPVCETIVAGDINGDCKVDFKDFALMAFHWLRDENQ